MERPLCCFEPENTWVCSVRELPLLAVRPPDFADCAVLGFADLVLLATDLPTSLEESVFDCGGTTGSVLSGGFAGFACDVEVLDGFS